MDSGLLSALIGFAGVVVGLLLSELLRRQRRIEKFSEVYFSKRIEAYEKMYQDFVALTGVFSDLKEINGSTEIKMKVWHEQVLDFLAYTDAKALFIDQILTVHLGMTLIGAGGFLEGEKDKSEDDILRDFKKSKLLIRESLGLRNIEKSFRSTAKPKYSSEYIDYFTKVKKQVDLKEKKR